MLAKLFLKNQANLNYNFDQNVAQLVWPITELCRLHGMYQPTCIILNIYLIQWAGELLGKSGILIYYIRFNIPLECPQVWRGLEFEFGSLEFANRVNPKFLSMAITVMIFGFFKPNFLGYRLPQTFGF